MERLLGLLGRKFGRWTPAGGPDGPGILGDIRQALSISTLEEAEIGGHPFVRWLYPAKDRTPQDLEILTRRLSQSQPAFSIKQYYLARRWFHSSVRWFNPAKDRTPLCPHSGAMPSVLRSHKHTNIWRSFRNRRYLLSEVTFLAQSIDPCRRTGAWSQSVSAGNGARNASTDFFPDLSSGKDTLPAQWLLAEKGFIGFNKESN